MELASSSIRLKIRMKIHFYHIISVCCLILIAFCLPTKIGIYPSYAYVAAGDFYDMRFEPREKVNAERIDQKISSFFAYLDKQQYTKQYGFAKGSNNQFNQIVELLLQNSPVVVRELDSISSVLKNCFYFSNILGQKRILFIKDILENESDIIEPFMYYFYIWLNSDDDSSQLDLIKPSLEETYRYAHFFLETFGGRNYLFRADPKVRKLALFYCVLAIDQANDKGLNSNGTDIRPHLVRTIKELANQVDLLHRNEYLTELNKLRGKYRL